MRDALGASLFGKRRGRAAWRTVVWIVLLCFTLQTYITQTHVHLAAHPAGTAPILKTVKNPPLRAPSDSDPATCPFCQAIFSAGAFFTPTAPVLVLPSQWFDVAAPFASVGIAPRAVLTGWNSRAPPQH